MSSSMLWYLLQIFACALRWASKSRSAPGVTRVTLAMASFSSASLQACLMSLEITMYLGPSKSGLLAPLGRKPIPGTEVALPSPLVGPDDGLWGQELQVCQVWELARHDPQELVPEVPRGQRGI